MFYNFSVRSLNHREREREREETKKKKILQWRQLKNCREKERESWKWEWCVFESLKLTNCPLGQQAKCRGYNNLRGVELIVLRKGNKRNERTGGVCWVEGWRRYLLLRVTIVNSQTQPLWDSGPYSITVFQLSPPFFSWVSLELHNIFVPNL